MFICLYRMWRRAHDDIGRMYFYNVHTLETTWHCPSGMQPDALIDMAAIHQASKVRTCLRASLDRIMRSAFSWWAEVAKKPSRYFVGPIANSLSEWMRMRDTAVGVLAQSFRLKDEVTSLQERLMALEKVEFANQEWDRLAAQKAPFVPAHVNRNITRLTEPQPDR